MFESIEREIESSLQENIDRQQIREHVDALAGLRRYPGTDDQWAAAEYIIDTLNDGGVTTELSTFEAYTSVPGNANVTVTAPTRRELSDPITIAFSGNTPEGGVHGEVVHVDTIGDDPDTLGQVSGRVVFTRGLPTPAKVRTLEAADAAAVVFRSPTEGYLHEMIVSPVWGSPSSENADELPDLPVVEIHVDDGKWLAERLGGDTVEATVETQTTTELTELPCPIARIEGTESDRYMVVGNHIDSWHEGVTDNGTAVAASMELARIFATNPPKRGIVFGFWPGHSMGRYAGSARYADDNWLDLRENGVAYLHIDLNGLDGADRIWSQHMAEVESEHLDILEEASLPLDDGSGDGDLIAISDRPGRNSDQSFWGTGLSSLLSGARFSADHEDSGPVGGGWWWHTPADTRDKVDFDLLIEEVELYVAIISRFCNSPILPHDFQETSKEIRETVDEIANSAGDAVNFSPVYHRLDTLDTQLAEFTTAVDDRNADGIDADVEDLQVRLGNHLIPALYMSEPEYKHDPALPHDLLPALREAEQLPNLIGPKRAFTERTVARNVTKLAHQIDQTIDTLESFLDYQA